MKHVCKICGYVYDDSEQAVPFEQLPDTWVCPLCGAPKAEFEAEGKEAKEPKPKAAVIIDEDMQKLSIGELSAVCSNLARGCEKQYKQEESELFTELAQYFSDIAPAEETVETAEITKLIQSDLEHGFADVKAIASDRGDRGALRANTWSEKVTRILNSLLQRYEKEGEAFLADTEVWVCTACGFVFIGDEAPELCPVCKVPSWKFEKNDLSES